MECFLEQQAPASPYVDSGGITQQIVVSGNVLITNVECGAVVGNNVGVYIDDVKLLKAQRGGGMQGAGENNLLLSDGGTLPQNQIVSRTHTTQLNCIYTGKAIENEFLKIAEGCAQDVNKIYTYRIEYPAFTISVPVKIQAVSVTDGAGVFLQYTLTLQTAGRRQAVSNIPTQGTMNIVIQMPGETGGSNTAAETRPIPQTRNRKAGFRQTPFRPRTRTNRRSWLRPYRRPRR